MKTNKTTKDPKWLLFLKEEEDYYFTVTDKYRVIAVALESLLFRIQEVWKDIAEYEGLSKQQIKKEYLGVTIEKCGIGYFDSFEIDRERIDDIIASRNWLKKARQYYREGVGELRQQTSLNWKSKLADKELKPIYFAILKSPDDIFLNIFLRGV